MTLVPATAKPERRGHVLDGLQVQPPDGLLALIGMHRSDRRAGKLDVGVGVYRDAAGATPVFRAVKAAETRLLAEQRTKAYLGAEGDAEFVRLLEPIVFGASFSGSDRLRGVQTPGGSGALRLGAELVSQASPGACVWAGHPTWPNHAPIFEGAGLQVRAHRYFDQATSRFEFGGMMDDLDRGGVGDVVLLHGSCHNPTGQDLLPEQWRELGALLATRGMMPFFDLAYQGMAIGLDGDAAGMRTVLDQVPEALIAYSCDKNFGLYRERVGALWVLGRTSHTAESARATVLMLARSLWSMPPDHGAAIVRTILQDVSLESAWRDELEAMRARLVSVRAALASAHPALAPVAGQHGLFSLLPIGPAAVTDLRERHGIYMAASGRINVAGLSEATVAPFVAALAPHIGE